MGFRQCSFRLIMRALRDGTVNAFGCLPLLGHALFPSGFRLQVNQTAQKLPSEFLLTASGIQHRVPRRTVSVHPALQCRVLRMKAESPIRATSTLVEPSACPPSSCPGHYPRRWATTGTLSPWALLPVGNPVVVCLVRSTFRVSVRPLPLLSAGCVLSEDHAGSAQTP